MTTKAPVSNRILKHLVRQKTSKKEVKNNYEKWATDYDKDLEELEYRADIYAAIKTSELFPPEVRAQIKILDVGAGTGLLGSKLKKEGFNQIDGLEPVKDMLEVAKGKAIYNKYYTDYLTDKPLDIKQGTYDVVTGSAMFGYSLVPYQAITEMIRLIKSGGYIVLSMREGVLDYDEYKGMVPFIEQLEKEGHIKVITRTTYPDHYRDVTGILFVFQKI